MAHRVISRCADQLVALGEKQTFGSGGSPDLRRSATSGPRDIGVLPGGPAKTDGRHMAPDDSAESTGKRLEARHPGSRTRRKVIHLPIVRRSIEKNDCLLHEINVDVDV